MTLQNVLGDLALDLSITDFAEQAYNSNADSYRVGTSKSRFKDDFFNFDTTNNWTVISNPAAQLITVAGDTGGARYLNINSGVNAGDETILLSKQTFKPPVKFACAVSISQRIANQEFYIELVGVDGNGSVVTETTLGQAPTVNNTANAISMFWDGVSATAMKYAIRAEGISELVSGALPAVTTVATGATPNFSAAAQFEILLQTELANVTARPVNSAAAGTQIINRTDYVPDTSLTYAVRIRVKNLGTAPASATDFRVHFIRLIDAARMSVDFGMVGGSNMSMAGAPVNVITAPTITVSGPAASGGTASGNPVRKALIARSATPTAVTNGQQVDAIATLAGVQIIKPYAIPELDWAFACAAGGIINTTDVSVMALSATLRRYIVGITIKNVHATTATEVVLKDGSTVIWRGHLPAAMENADVIQFATPLKTTVNQALNFACLTTGAQVYVSAQGYSAP